MTPALSVYQPLKDSSWHSMANLGYVATEIDFYVCVIQISFFFHAVDSQKSEVKPAHDLRCQNDCGGRTWPGKEFTLW